VGAPKEPIEVGEWVDPSVPLPDHPIRRTAWWQVVNRLPRPVLNWVTVALWVILAGRYLFLNTIPDDVWFWSLCGWTGIVMGITTYEKRLGIV